MKIDTAADCYQLARIEYAAGAYTQRDEALWNEVRSLQGSVQPVLPLTETFKSKITDPGAYLISAGRNLALTDIYVYPDLLPVNVTGNANQQRVYFNAGKLQDREQIECGVLVAGEERSGKTSLLYQLFVHYHASGMVPILLDGAAISSIHDRDLERVIKRAVQAQYGPAAAKAIEQTSRKNKIVLVDDLDQGSLVASAARATILKLLKARFAHVVVTVGAMFEMAELLQGDTKTRLEDFRHYKLQAFGNVKRSTLIKRWFRLHDDGSVDDGTFIGKCDGAERVLNAVMDTSLIPHVPLHLLTLLQSIGDGRSGELENSSLASYYEFLLTQALLRAGVKQDKIDDYTQYCSYLAWHFHMHGTGGYGSDRLISTNELRAFHEFFCDEFFSIDFSASIDILQKARVLQHSGQDFCFRYPYIYYYLKGKYISLEIQNNEDLPTYVASCCDHLYVRDNANTVLFLAHHMSNNLVIDHIARALKLLFEDVAPTQLADDVDGVNKLIYQAPELVYQGGSPETHRDKRDADADARVARGGEKDHMADQAEQSPKLSLTARLVLLTKTSAILGQLINAQNARIRRQRKHELIKEIYDGNLRALNNFFAMMTENSEPLMMQLRGLLKEKSKDLSQAAGEAFARRFVSQAIETVSIGLILKAARNTTSDELADVVASVVEDNATNAYRIIELATLLDSPKDLPRKVLLALNTACGSNLVAIRVIRHLDLNRLYMFKTSQQDLFWLHENMKMDIKAIQKVSYGRPDARLA